MKIKKIACAIGLLSMSFVAYAQEVFVPNARGGIDPLTRAVVMGNKTSNGMFALYGKKMTSSLVLDGRSSMTILPRMSTVFYVFTPKNLPISAWKMIPVKQKKKTRELPFMKTGVYSGTKTEIDDVQLMVNKISDEIYELRPISDLKNGEYVMAYIENGVPALLFDFRVEQNLPPFPTVSEDTVLAEFDADSKPTTSDKNRESSPSTPILRWYFDSDPRGARIFYRVISQIPDEVKNTNESYLTTTPLEETKALNIPGLTYENASDVVIEIKVTKRGFEEQVKRYNVRQAMDQQEISGFFELVEK